MSSPHSTQNRQDRYQTPSPPSNDVEPNAPVLGDYEYPSPTRFSLAGPTVDSQYEHVFPYNADTLEYVTTHENLTLSYPAAQTSKVAESKGKDTGASDTEATETETGTETESETEDAETKNTMAKVAEFPNTDLMTMEPKVILILILDHGKAWADTRHQELLNQFVQHNYKTVSSTPATAVMSITRYNPEVILIIEAITLNKTCDRKIITERLRDFANAGGVVIFGGVPWAFNPADQERAGSVFNTAMHVDWTVGESFEMEVQDTSAQMQMGKVMLEGTYLEHVPVAARLYGSQTEEDEADEPCAVVLQGYGKGIVGYLGSADLFSDVSTTLLLGMYKMAEGMKVTQSGKTPAETMMGEVYSPLGWTDNGDLFDKNSTRYKTPLP